MVAFRCDLARGQQIYIENQESLTAIALLSGGSNQQQSQRQSFETGKWHVPPIVFQSSSGVVLRIEAEQGQYFIQVQANGMSRINTVPSLSDADVLPMRQVDEADSSHSLPDMQPMKPMKPMSPIQMDDMQMQMQMGNMAMRMGELIGKKVPESRQLTKNFCNQCGSKVEAEDRFCSDCGNRLVPVET